MTRILSALLAVAVFACSAPVSDAAYRRDSTGLRDSVAAVAAASMDEGTVIGLLQETHAADSALGALGAQKGTSTDVKEFGRMILREHMALGREAGNVARDLGLVVQSPRVPPDAAPEGMRRSVEAGAAGAAWDRTYMDYAVAMHEAAMENMARALAATKRPEVKDAIARAVPILQKHMDKAKALQQRLPNPPADKAAKKP